MRDFNKVLNDLPLEYPKVLESLNTIHAENIIDSGEGTNKANMARLTPYFPKLAGSPLVRLLTTKNHADSSPAKAHRVGVVFSGGPAPGGHNVLCGIYDGLKKLHGDAKLYGFRGGPSGIIHNDSFEITEDHIKNIKNTGGFHFLGTGRTKLETEEQFHSCLKTAKTLQLDGLVVIGGDDSNTNAAFLAEFFKAQGSAVHVIGVPKTIDGDLKNRFVETSFGFDTAAGVYSEIVSNIAQDAMSSRKYYHFIRLMGRSASHITLETTLRTHINMAIMSEEVADKKESLGSIVKSIGEMIIARSNKGLNYGVILVPEGLIEFIEEMKLLIQDLSTQMAQMPANISLSAIEAKMEQSLPPALLSTYQSLPGDIRKQLLLERDPHGNVQVSLIETEKLLCDLVKKYLTDAKKDGRYKGKFSSQCHFLGYEGRCAAPSYFDACYAYSLGRNAAGLVNLQLTGYMSVIRNLNQIIREWEPIGVPLIYMMDFELRHGKQKPVIKKGLVELNSSAFRHYVDMRPSWAETDSFLFSGPLQYFGPDEVVKQTPLTIGL